MEINGRRSPLAAATGRSKSYYPSELVTAGIDDLEYAHGLLTRAEAIRAGRRKTQPLDDLMSDLAITREQLDAMPDLLSRGPRIRRGKRVIIALEWATAAASTTDSDQLQAQESHYGASDVTPEGQNHLRPICAWIPAQQRSLG